MTDFIADIRRKLREEHKRKKEEERRRKQEQERKEREALQTSNADNTENDGFTRVYDFQPSAKPPPAARRSLDDEFQSELPPRAPGNLQSARLPTAGSYVDKSVSASPLSDVTCSQSPSHVAIKPAPKLAVSFTRPERVDENDEEDPIMAIMKQNLEKKKKRKLQAKAAADSPRKMEIDTDDPLEIQRRLSLEKAQDPHEIALLKQKEEERTKRNANVESVDDDPLEIQRRLSLEKTKDPLEIARLKQKEKDRIKRNKNLESDNDDDGPFNVAKNPFALMEQNYARHSFSPQDKARPQKTAADLWDDSDEEELKPRTKKKKEATRPNGEKRKSSPGENKRAPVAAIKRGTVRRDSREDEDNSDIDFDEQVLKPEFAHPKLGPPSPLEPLILPKRKDQEVTHQIPAAINRYLRGYQQHGVTFLYSCIMRGSGAILGDDMGLGKTVQVISLLASLLRKTGTGKDALKLNRRRKLISQKLREIKAANDEALLSGGAPVMQDSLEIEGLAHPEWAPILVIVPPSVIDNWKNEFETWGHFEVGTYQGGRREKALQKVKEGISEVLVVGKSLAMTYASKLMEIPWKLIVVDEVHAYKNNNSKSYKRLRELRDECQCPMIGLTGTIMNNNHEELYNLIDLHAPGHLGDEEDFKTRFSEPIKYARVKDADHETIQKSISSNHELDRLLQQVYITRTKKDELGDELPEKDETVLFCELTDMQKALYQRILQLPDYELLRYANAPCDCGENRRFFIEYQRLRTKEERIAYQRRNRERIVRRKKCCYQIPKNPNWDPDDPDDDEQPHIFPSAVLWRFQHENDEQCDYCPFCISFPAFSKLYLLSNHAALLLAEKDPSSHVEGSQPWRNATKAVAFAEAAIPQDILNHMPGSRSNPYVRDDGIMNDHALMSGKMKMLDKLLRKFDQVGNNRILLFSHYTKTLDLIQQFVSACGYSFIRLDGSTSAPDRQKLVDRFQKDSSIFLFLISTKAGGLGLNLTAANKVITFDLDFNPSHDEQAQDRAYRIGQTADVQVIRLIAQGTIEEQKYIRQIYKGHLKNDTLRDVQETEQVRMFRGVQGDKYRKGEIFGIENLLKFKPDGSFMGDLWKSSEKRSSRADGTVRQEELANALSNLSGDQVESIGGGHDDSIGDNLMDQYFHNAAHASQALGQSDGFMTAKRASRKYRDTDGQPSDGEDDDVDIDETLRGGNALKHQELFANHHQGGNEKEGEDMEEVLGGASQNIMAVFDNGRAEDEGDDEPVDNADNHDAVETGIYARAMPQNASAVPDNSPPLRMEEAHMDTTAVASSPSVDETHDDYALSQKRIPYAIKRATIGNVAGKYDDPIEEDDNSDDEQNVAKAPSPPPAKKATTNAPPSNGEPSGLERTDKVVVATAPGFPATKKSAPPSKARANGKKKTEPTKPTFSASDLFQVSYDKKKKKKKKKSKKLFVTD